MSQLAILYIVPTPIGHLADITQRALQVLQEVDLIIAEDTRHSGRLLKHFDIKSHLFALHDHNERSSVPLLVEKLQAGSTMALIADAGTPLVCDPGFHLVRRCHALGIRVIPLPGPCAAITALSAAGIATDRFCFEGFLPAKRPERCRDLQALAEEPRTMIFYESCHRLLESLQDIMAVFGAERYVVLARELTKLWEQIQGAPVGQLLDWVKCDPWRCRGEMVLVVTGYQATDQAPLRAAQQTLTLLMAELPLKKAATLAATIHNVKKNSLYRYGLSLATDTKSDP